MTPLEVVPAAPVGSGHLRCARCGEQFPVEDGVPDFTAAGLADERQSRERTSRDEIVVYGGTVRVRYEWQVETEAILRRLQARPGDRVLDAGCGNGRIARPLLKQGVCVTAIDFSPARLHFLRSHVPPGSPLTVAVADVTRLPFPAGSFDRVVSGQVLEHIPDPQLRRQAVVQMLRVLAPGGTAVLTVYNYSRTYRKMGQPQEIFHPTGVFDHRYTADELRRDFEGLEIHELCGIASGIPGGNRLLPYIGRVGRWIDHACEKWPHLSCNRGAFLLIWATKAV
jgi:SAM-dependent methyltransferase